jgi:5-methylcytosine-specific restriction endonuclease McrA
VPTAPRQTCVVCGRLTAGPRCARHRRPSAALRGYDAAWRDVARAFLRQFPWCGQRADGRFSREHSACARRGLRVRARLVDHIRPLPDGPRLDAANLQSLCVSCNTRKGGPGW